MIKKRPKKAAEEESKKEKKLSDLVKGNVAPTRTILENHKYLRPSQRRFPTRVKMYCLNKYLVIDPVTGKHKYTLDEIVELCNNHFGIEVVKTALANWRRVGKWKEIRERLFADAAYRAMGKEQSKGIRRVIIRNKMAEYAFFEPSDALDMLHAPYYDKLQVATTIVKRAAEQNQIAHKAIKFAAKKKMLMSGKDCSEKLAISPGEANNIFTNTSKVMKEFIGVVSPPSAQVNVINTVQASAANSQQTQVNVEQLNMSMVTNELVLRLFGDEQMRAKNPRKIAANGEHEEAEIVNEPDNDEFIRSTEGDKS